MTINSDPQLNETDLELLSAYIDRRLADGERAALERRLSQEPALRGALDELRATVALLHELEPLKPPRSFAIPAPAAAPRRLWSFSWPAIGSALVALACLLTFSYALIRSSSGSGGSTASAPAPAAVQEAAAPTAAGAAAPNSAMRQAATAAPAAAAEAPAAAAPVAAPAEATAAPAAAAPTAALAAEAPTAAPAAAAPMAAADAATAAPAAAAPVAAPAEATAAPAAGAAAIATPAPTAAVASSAGLLATKQPASAPPRAADSAAPAAGAAPKSTDSPTQPYVALVATSESSSPGTVGLDQPPVAPAANSAPARGSNNLGLIAGAVLLALLIGAGVWFARRRRERR